MEASKSVSKPVVEFVKDLEGLKPEALVRQGPGLANDEKLLGNLMEFLLSEQCSEEQVLLERFYSQMLRCYRTFDEHLMRFVSQFTFCLIWRHFSDLTKSRQYGIAIRPGLDALLVAVYNMAIVDSEGHPRAQAYTIPSLGNPSLYHDPAEFTMHILRNSARQRAHDSEEKRVVIGNFPSVDTLTRAKKWTVFRVLMRSLSQDLPYHSKACQKSAIIMCRLLVPSSAPSTARNDVELAVRREPKQLAGLNFDRLNFKSFSMGKDKVRSSQVHAKIVLDERFLLDLLDILYILAYQGLYEESLGLVLDLLEEGEYRILASVVLVGSAIRSRLESSKLEPDELDEVPPINSGSAGGASGEETGRKSLVTNGSIREKRRRSFAGKKIPQTSRPEDSFNQETTVNEGDEVSRSETPNTNEPILEMGGPTSHPATPLWSPDVSPQQFVKVSSRTNTNGMSETIV